MDGVYLERFRSRIRRGEPGECWEWDGAHTTAGYPETWDGTKPIYAHRVSHEVWNGPIPDGYTVDHLCKNPGCVNPDHLEAVTQQTNILRSNGMSARHARKTHCDYGHEFTDENTHLDNRGRRNCRACYRRRNRKKVQACPQGHPYTDGNYTLNSRGYRQCLLCANTHCSHGHGWTEDNTYVSKRGDRHCRACARERARKRRAKAD